MYAITLINKTGGSRTVIGSLRSCKEEAYKITVVFKSYLAATIPYKIFKRDNCYDVTVPFEIKKSLGVELRLLLNENESI